MLNEIKISQVAGYIISGLFLGVIRMTWHFLALKLICHLSSQSCSDVKSFCNNTPFLQNRQQSVILEGAASEQAPVLSGVPQGTVLGPITVSDLSWDSHDRFLRNPCWALVRILFLSRWSMMLLWTINSIVYLKISGRPTSSNLDRHISNIDWHRRSTTRLERC
jgi:hypothetical protein